MGLLAASVSLFNSDLSWRELAAFAPILILLLAFIVYCLVDLVRAPSVRYLPKIVWALVIIFGSAPIGPIIYLVLGKERYGHGERVPDRESVESK